MKAQAAQPTMKPQAAQPTMKPQATQPTMKPQATQPTMKRQAVILWLSEELSGASGACLGVLLALYINKTPLPISKTSFALRISSLYFSYHTLGEESLFF